MCETEVAVRLQGGIVVVVGMSFLFVVCGGCLHGVIICQPPACQREREMKGEMVLQSHVHVGVFRHGNLS